MRTGLNLADNRHHVQLAYLDLGSSEAVRIFTEDNASAIEFVDPFEPRGEVHRITDHGVGLGCRRTERANDHLASGDAHTDDEVRRVAPQPGDVRQLRPQRHNGRLLRERRAAGGNGVLIAWGERW